MISRYATAQRWVSRRSLGREIAIWTALREKLSKTFPGNGSRVGGTFPVTKGESSGAIAGVAPKSRVRSPEQAEFTALLSDPLFEESAKKSGRMQP